MTEQNEKSNVQKQFGQNAENYVTSQTHAKGVDLKKLVGIQSFLGDEFVLDIATGGGHVANAVASRVKKVVAFDLTDEILEAARGFIEMNGHRNVEFVKGDAEQLPFSDEEFDVITCRIAAHHFPNPKAFVQEVFRTLKKGGTFLFIDNVAPELDSFDQFYNKVEKDRDYSHQRAWKKTEWIEMLEKADFDVEEMYTFKKTFIYENWTNMMKLSKENKEKLSTFMLDAPDNHHKKFNIKIEDSKIVSFQGESILIKARKG
ncbi:class I SAM-dependent methyltransferase [Halalkalibacter krulwichiae]|uniref:Putative methyltransferase YcgJ n=1 Tax=Halalkalibacter krulwichiae TaxID=199441 RepID=A0A1X9MI30_9BACI|nr:class I SAM-dependent methyltransferase [Halalkalibacter krulwichiae]ARK30202.1 putative methyltransferase YcgJ [Halalkalibacter krulwichiae]